MRNWALESQQFAEQTAQRRDRALEQQSHAWQQLPGLVDRFQSAYGNQQELRQREAKMQMQQAEAASELAKDQLDRQRAAEELMWARELHATDVSKAQADAAMAQSRLSIAQSQQEIEKLRKSGMQEMPKDYLDEEQMHKIRAGGWKWTPGGSYGLGTIQASTDEERSQSKAWLERNERRQAMRLYESRYGGVPPAVRSAYEEGTGGLPPRPYDVQSPEEMKSARLNTASRVLDAKLKELRTRRDKIVIDEGDTTQIDSEIKDVQERLDQVLDMLMGDDTIEKLLKNINGER